jgi:hypothetical protein
MGNLTMIGVTTGTKRLRMLVSHNTLRRIVFSFLLLLIVAVSSMAKEWRGIVPLHSTRTDVERLLGPPTTDRSDTVFYESEVERVSIDFSKGPCNVEFSSWNVARNTVISIWVTPRNGLNAADLNLSQNKYLKIPDKHLSDIVYYRDEQEGIEYSVNVDTGRVDLIKYLPSAVDEPLRCPEPRNRLRETVKLAQYSNISFAAEKNFLDKFAQELIRYSSINYASARGYILAYDGKQRSVPDATSRARRAKKYLIKKHHIDADRIETRYAGYRQMLTIELYLVPPGGSVPRSERTVDPKHLRTMKKRVRTKSV